SASFSSYSSPSAVLEKSDIIVTSVPGTSSELGFLDIAETRQDVFIAAIDLGRSWNVKRVAEAGPYLVTDDLVQTRALIGDQAFPLALDFETDLPEMAANGHKALQTGRVMFVCAGNAWADLAGAI